MFCHQTSCVVNKAIMIRYSNITSILLNLFQNLYFHSLRVTFFLRELPLSLLPLPHCTVASVRSLPIRSYKV